MDEKAKLMNEFLVGVFNEILKTEEACLANSEFADLSLREMHVIEAASQGSCSGRNSAAQLALALGITAGTLTTTVNLLTQKGYLSREKDATDRRKVRITLTDKGQMANKAHLGFHEEMVGSIQSCLSSEEAHVFVRGLDSVSRFFKQKYEKGAT